MLEKYKNYFVKELDTKFLDEVKEYGYCHISESYSNETEQLIRIEVYEYDCKTYLIRYVDKECVMFKDITAIKR